MTETSRRAQPPTSSEEHRDIAEQALAAAQRNPVQSAEESFLAAQVHALLAIEQQLALLVDGLRRRDDSGAATHDGDGSVRIVSG